MRFPSTILRFRHILQEVLDLRGQPVVAVFQAIPAETARLLDLVVVHEAQRLGRAGQVAPGALNRSGLT